MDLVRFAHDNGLSAHVPAIQTWLTDLQTTREGQQFVAHLRGETALTHAPDCETVLRTLVAEIVSWHATRGLVGTALRALKETFERTGCPLLCRGREVPDNHDTDTLCRMTSLRNVSSYLTTAEAKVNLGVIPGATTKTVDEGLLRDWGHMFLEDPNLVDEAIQPDSYVRGQLPLIFASPEEDRVSKWPRGTGLSRVFEVLGLVSAPEDQCVQTFRQADVGRGRVPAALDAYTYEHFRPARWNARWGITRDLEVGTGFDQTGVRECVLPQFEARLLASFDLIEA